MAPSRVPVGLGFLAKEAPWLKGLLEALAGLPPRAWLAGLYGYRLCGGESCDQLLGFAAAAVVEAAALGVEPEPILGQLPRHARLQAERALSEASDAYVRSPGSIYAQVALDADALSRMAALGTAYPASNRRDLGSLLHDAAEAMSWAAASDYVLYTRTARSQASRVLRPHTLAYAKWLAEELSFLGYQLVPRTETGSAGIVSYLDLRRCPCGTPVKDVVVKPMRECIEYRVTYDCCGDRLGFKLCAPESTRIR